MTSRSSSIPTAITTSTTRSRSTRSNTEWDLFLAKALSRRGTGRRRMGDPRTQDGRPCRGNAQRRQGQGPVLVRRVRHPVESSCRARPSPCASARWRPVAHQLLAGRVAAQGEGWEVQEGSIDSRGQLGLVASGRRRHASPRVLGHRAVLDRGPGQRFLSPRSRRPGRNRLIEVYHAQRRFHDKYKRWADQISALDLPARPAGSPEPPITIRATPDGFEAAITFTPAGGTRQTWTIRQDSRVVRTP